MIRLDARTLLCSLVALGSLGCSAVLPPGFGQASPEPAAVAGAPSFKTTVVPILKQNCASCHSTGGMAARSVELFDASGNPQYTIIKTRAADIVSSIRSGRMPLGMPDAVSAEELKQLEDWHKAGAPEN